MDSRQALFQLVVRSSNTFTGLLDRTPVYYKNVKLSHADCVTIDNFLNFIEESYKCSSIGVKWIMEYSLFQYKFYRNSEEAVGKKAMNLLFGQKAIERWLNKPQSWLFHTYNNCSHLNVSLIKRYIANLPKPKYDLHKIYERERQVYLNSDRGLLHCIDTTSMYSPESIVCRICNNADLCKKIKNAI